MLPQNFTYASLSPTWQGKTWDLTNPTHEAQMMSYMAYLIGVTTSGPVPAVWEYYPDEDFKLFGEK